MMARWFLLSLLLGAVAFAEDTAKARDAFLKGQQLYSAGKYKEALAKFEESFSAKPHPATIFNMARCQDQLGELVTAMTSYKEYLRQSPQATDADEVATAVSSIEARLQKRGVQHLLVWVDPPMAKVTVDGKELTGAPASAAITPGTHKVVITAAGFDQYERAFAMSAARSMELTISLRPSAATPPVAKVEPTKPTDPVKPAEPVKVSDAPRSATLTPPPEPPLVVSDGPEPAPRKRVFTWAAAGTAAVATGLGVAFGVAMKGAEKALNTPADRSRAEATKLYNDAYGFGTAATISFITAGVAAAAAVVLFFLEGA
jgi:tetratricopeptide (TPR) repeat protein